MSEFICKDGKLSFPPEFSPMTSMIVEGGRGEGGMHQEGENDDAH